jgi:hypothetical protein
MSFIIVIIYYVFIKKSSDNLRKLLTTPTARGILATPSNFLVRGLAYLCGQHPQHPAKAHRLAHAHGYTASVCLVTGVDKSGFAIGPTYFKGHLVHLPIR